MVDRAIRYTGYCGVSGDKVAGVKHKYKCEILNCNDCIHVKNDCVERTNGFRFLIQAMNCYYYEKRSDK